MSVRTQEMNSTRRNGYPGGLRKTLVCGSVAFSGLVVASVEGVLVSSSQPTSTAELKSEAPNSYDVPSAMRVGTSSQLSTRYEMVRPLSTSDYNYRNSQDRNIWYAGLASSCNYRSEGQDSLEWSGFCANIPTKNGFTVGAGTPYRFEAPVDGQSGPLTYKMDRDNKGAPARGLDVFVQQISGRSIPSYYDGDQRLNNANWGGNELFGQKCCKGNECPNPEQPLNDGYIDNHPKQCRNAGPYDTTSKYKVLFQIMFFQKSSGYEHFQYWYPNNSGSNWESHNFTATDASGHGVQLEQFQQMQINITTNGGLALAYMPYSEGYSFCDEKDYMIILPTAQQYADLMDQNITTGSKLNTGSYNCLKWGNDRDEKFEGNLQVGKCALEGGNPDWTQCFSLGSENKYNTDSSNPFPGL